jgi:hypothetical protein
MQMQDMEVEQATAEPPVAVGMPHQVTDKAMVEHRHLAVYQEEHRRMVVGKMHMDHNMVLMVVVPQIIIR